MSSRSISKQNLGLSELVFMCSSPDRSAQRPFINMVYVSVLFWLISMARYWYVFPHDKYVQK